MNLLTLFILVIAIISTYASKQYFIFRHNKLNWHAAFADCLSRDLQLATITSSDEQVILDSTIHRSKAARDLLWISGSDQGEEGSFVWMSTGKAITYHKWSVGQPDNLGGVEHCMNVWQLPENNFTWNDQNCGDKFYYICEDKLQSK